MMKKKLIVTLIVIFACCAVPRQASAWASLWVDPVFDVGQSVGVYWNADTDYCWYSYYKYVEASVNGSDGFYLWEWNEYGNGGGTDTYASLGGPYSVYYYLFASVYTEDCDYEVFSESAVSNPFPAYPVSTQVIAGEYVQPPTQVCALATGCTQPPWEYLRTYQLIDQWERPYHAVAYVYETISILWSDCVGSIDPRAAMTNSAGQFYDRFAICSDACCTNGYCGLQYEQYISADGGGVAYHYVDEDCYGINVISP